MSQPAAAPVWRQFSFFDLQEVKDVNDLGQSPEAFRSLTPPYILTSPSPASPLSSSISLIISTSDGSILLLDQKFQTIKKFTGWNVGVDSSNGNGNVGPKMEAGEGKAKAKASVASGAGAAGEGKGKERGVMLLECGGVLLGIGEDDSPNQFPILKIWDLMHEDKQTKEPILMRQVRLGVGNRGFSVSSITTTSNLSYLAIGLISGQVLLYKHLSQSLLTSPLAVGTFPKPKILMEGSMAEPITGLGFREPRSIVTGTPTTTTTTERTSLFVTTPNKTFVIPNIAGKASDPRALEDSLGSSLLCSTMTSSKKEFIVGREDGIYMYGLEGRGSVFAYEGQKHMVALYGKECLVIVSPPFRPNVGSNSATIRRSAIGYNNGTSNLSDNGSGSLASGIGNGSQSVKVTVFDLGNKFVAYSGVFREGVREVFSDGEGAIYIVGGDGKLSRLTEQSLPTKLDVLFRKSLYQLSLSLARSSGMEDSEIAGIYVKYGDHLYGKGDFDGSMGQFVKTLGHVQPSYVIRKFLDGQRIYNLTTYLQELHARGLANPDHTTLLLNCYTKTGDKARLDNFIKTETSRSGDKGESQELPFDLDTAIRVCRQAGFYEHAVYLAKKYQRHEDYLRIQLEDAKDYEDALGYIRQLGPKMAEQNLLRYGRTMLQQKPEPTTDLMIDLCSGTLLRKRKRALELASTAKASSTQAQEKDSNGGPAYLSYLGYENLTGLITGTGSDKDKVDGKATAIGSKVNDQSNEGASSVGLNEKKTFDLDAFETRYEPPSCRQFFAHFIDHPVHFVRFLESVAADRWRQTLSNEKVREHSHLQSPPLPVASMSEEEPDSETRDQRAIWNTLFELYLADAVKEDSSSKDVSREKALNLLLRADRLPLDPMHALILCSTNNFTSGLVRLWEKLGMYEDVLRFWMAQESNVQGEQKSPSENVLYHLNAYGPTNTYLYPLVLRYLSSTSALLARHTKDIRDILQIIDEERIMPALAVVQLLSRNGITSVGVVKDWLKAKVAETGQDIDSDQRLVQSYRSETTEKLKEIAELSSPDKPQVFQVTRCASCGGQLDLPSVHFMCKHSYHQRCLPDSDPECPTCARQFAVIREVRRNQVALAERHDLFLSEVQDAEDGFAVVAGAFGRGLFEKQLRDVPSS